MFPDRAADWRAAPPFAAIDAGIDRAREFDLTAEQDVARFLGLLTALGPDFPDRPEWAWAGLILRNAAASPSARIERLYREAEARYPDLEPLWAAWRS